MFAALTAAGLSAAAGLNAYVPFLIVALIARFTDLINLPTSFSWIESWWAIAIATILLAAEVVLDKIPAVDSINDMVGTAIRPTVGGLIAAASTGNTIDHSVFMEEHQWIAAVLGVVVAGVVHTGKATARPAINVASLGVGAPIVSTGEDVTSVGFSFAAIFAPLLVLLGLILLAWSLWWIWRRVRRLRRRRDNAAYA